MRKVRIFSGRHASPNRKLSRTIGGVRSLFSIYTRACQAQERNNLAHERMLKVQSARQIDTLQAAILSNKLVIQDMQIAELKYKLQAKGLLENEFKAANYEETRHG
jgi:hypothetical protein